MMLFSQEMDLANNCVHRLSWAGLSEPTTACLHSNKPGGMDSDSPKSPSQRSFWDKLDRFNWTLVKQNKIGIVFEVIKFNTELQMF